MGDFTKLPVGVLSVPVLVDDNGVQYDTHMFAGQFAFEACGDSGVSMRPRTDWCISFAGTSRAEPRNYTHGEIHKVASSASAVLTSAVSALARTRQGMGFA